MSQTKNEPKQMVAKLKPKQTTQSPVSEPMFLKAQYDIEKIGDTFRIASKFGKIKTPFYFHVSSVDFWITAEDWVELK